MNCKPTCPHFGGLMVVGPAPGITVVGCKLIDGPQFAARCPIEDAKAHVATPDDVVAAIAEARRVHP